MDSALQVGTPVYRGGLATGRHSQLSISFGTLERDTEKRKRIALRFARSIVRFQGNDFAANLLESTIDLARRIVYKKQGIKNE